MSNNAWFQICIRCAVLFSSFSLAAVSLRAAEPALLYRILDLESGEIAEQTEVPTDLLANDAYKQTRMVFRRIPAGSVLMNEGQTTATLTQDYWLAVFECTQAQWETVMDSNPSRYKGARRPLELGAPKRGQANTIRGGEWPGGEPADDSFMAKLRALTGGKYAFDLPTDVQWEHACRAGTTTDLNSGKDLSATLVCANMSEVGRYDGNRQDGRGGGFTTHTTVGAYAPNAWGLHDMHGNVWEQCLDWWWLLPKGDITDYPGHKGEVSGRVMRGGGWRDGAFFCTSAVRGAEAAGSATGFRVAIQP